MRGSARRASLGGRIASPHLPRALAFEGGDDAFEDVRRRPMTDLRNLTILGMMGRLNMLIDEGASGLTTAEVKRCIIEGNILDRLCCLYGDFPEFNPLAKAEAVLLRQELRTVVEKYDDREESKMGVARNGLCLLMGYCLEMLMERNLREVLG